MEAKSGGLLGGALRRPLQPRDSNVVSSPAAAGIKTKKAKPRPKPRPLVATASPPSVKSYVEPREVSLAEELENARERRERMRAARERTERLLQARGAVLEREAMEWEWRAEEQRKLVAELMQLIGMPEVYTRTESLRSKEERKRAEAHSDLPASSSNAPLLLEEGDGANSGDQEPEATTTTAAMMTTTAAITTEGSF